MPLLPSAATETQSAFWMEGACHVLAVALHRAHGWGIHLVLDEGEPFWEDPEDADNFIPSVLHAYAVDADGIAWDALGARPLGEVETECRRRWFPSHYGTDEIRSEDELRTYVVCPEESEEVERPLGEYDDRGVAEALAFAAAALGGIAGYPAPPAPPR